MMHCKRDSEVSVEYSITVNVLFRGKVQRKTVDQAYLSRDELKYFFKVNPVELGRKKATTDVKICFHSLELSLCRDKVSERERDTREGERRLMQQRFA